jgi:hypothetical protein
MNKRIAALQNFAVDLRLPGCFWCFLTRFYAVF